MRKLNRISVIGAVAVLAVSCAKDMIRPDTGTSMQSMTIKASQEGWSTKTSVDSETGRVYWTPGDAINIFFGDISARFVSSNTERTGVATFVCSQFILIGANEDYGIDENGYYGLYPYDQDATFDGQSITTTLPDIQEASDGTFPDNLYITMGRTDGERPEMPFYNVCGGIRFRVTGEGITKVTLTGNGGETLAGTFTMAFGDEGLPEVTGVVDGKTSVSLNCPEGFKPGLWYYIVTLPVELADGFTLAFEKIGGDATLVFDNPAIIKRAIFGSLDTVDKDVSWNEFVVFDDANFEAYCLANFDTDGDGIISLEEAADVTEISVETSDINSLKGIEMFTNLYDLSCSGSSVFSYDTYDYEPTGKLTSLDLSKNTALRSVSCYSNQLTSLDVSQNTALTNLNCGHNQLRNLDVGVNTNLRLLSCYSNPLTSLDVSKNTSLEVLDCDSNQLTSLDVSQNTALTNLDCASNHLTSLDVSQNTVLGVLRCSNNQLTSLDVSQNTFLTNFYCDSNQLTSLDVSNNTALVGLDCTNCQLTILDVSQNTFLTGLYCEYNPLKAIFLNKVQNFDYFFFPPEAYIYYVD